MTTPRNTGGDVNYYIIDIVEPKRLQPCKVEVEDIIEALDMTFAEGCQLKALVRSCVARKTGVIKKNYDGVIYDAEKGVYYAQRRLVQLQKEEKLRAAQNAAQLSDSSDRESPPRQTGFCEPDERVYARRHA